MTLQISPPAARFAGFFAFGGAAHQSRLARFNKPVGQPSRWPMSFLGVGDVTKAAARPCTYPGCGALVTSGPARCDAHRYDPKAERVRRDKRGARAYDRRAWRDGVRPAQLRREPLCRMCRLQLKLVPASEVDHIDGNEWDSANANLQSLCKPCHSRKTVAEQGALGHRGIKNDR